MVKKVIYRRHIRSNYGSPFLYPGRNDDVILNAVIGFLNAGNSEFTHYIVNEKEDIVL